MTPGQQCILNICFGAGRAAALCSGEETEGRSATREGGAGAAAGGHARGNQAGPGPAGRP